MEGFISFKIVMDDTCLFVNLL